MRAGTSILARASTCRLALQAQTARTMIVATRKGNGKTRLKESRGTNSVQSAMSVVRPCSRLLRKTSVETGVNNKESVCNYSGNKASGMPRIKTCGVLERRLTCELPHDEVIASVT